LAGCKAANSNCLPGSGVGFALERFVGDSSERERLLQTMMEQFPFFEDLINNVEMGLAKADLSIARSYAELVVDVGAAPSRVFGLIGRRIRKDAPRWCCGSAAQRSC